MRRSTVSKDGVKNMARIKHKNSMKIDPSKLQKFCYLWSMNVPPKEIQKELGIGQAQYYRYIDAAEEISDDYILGMIDHGLVLQFRETLLGIRERVIRLKTLAKKALDELNNGNIIEKDPKKATMLFRVIEIANSTDKLYNEMLDDTKLVNEADKVLKKVISQNTQNKK